MFCPKCGTQLPDGASFCGSCGSQLGAAPAPAAQAGPVPAAATAGAGGVVKSRKPFVIGGAAVVVVAVAVIVYFVFFAPYNLDERTFPDASVRTALAAQADANFDGKISRDEAKALTSLNLGSSGVTTLEGLDKFPNLAKLDLSATSSLYQADFNQVKGVSDLNIAGSALPTADISMLGNLQTLRAGGSGITELDVSKNTKLTTLRVDDSVAVTGVEETGVRAQYLMTGASLDYNALGYDMNGVGGGVEHVEYSFTYNDDNTLASFVSTFTNGYNNDKSSQGRRYTYEDGKLVKGEATNTSYANSTELSYDEAGRVVEGYYHYNSSSSSGSTTYGFEYGDADKLVSFTARASSSTSENVYVYNDANQLTAVQFPSRTYSSSDTTFSYDQAGHLISADAEYAAYEFDYNDAGQLTTKRVWFTERSERTSDNATTITFEYSADGKVTGATRVSGGNGWSNMVAADVTYNENGLVSGVSRHMSSSGSGTTHDYDGDASFTYKRVFTAKDAADLAQPMELGDPTTQAALQVNLLFDVLGRDKQSPIAYLTCDNLTQLYMNV